MEVFSMLVDLISSVGFPIAMCLLMWVQLDRERASHKEETAILTQAVNNNTAAISLLTEKLER